MPGVFCCALLTPLGDRRRGSARTAPEVDTLRDEDMRLEAGRASHRGDFLRLTHLPTGLVRAHPGPLLGVDRHALLRTWAEEIEAELRSQGKFEHIVPAYPTKSTRQKRR